MSPQRVADAARISPFTDSQESQQGRSTASGSENADSSQSRHKKAVKKPPRDRNGRQGQEEEMRFNIGPPSTRSINSSRGRRSTRAGRQDRLHSDGRNDIDVPNYPPPSFQEAISSSALSIYPSTTTLVPTSISYVSPEVLDEAAQQPPVPLPHPQQLSETSVSRELTPESDSESSIELVERTDGQLPSGRQLEEQVKDAWRRQHGVEFPRPAAVAPDLLSLRSVGAMDAQQRGRSPIRLDTGAEHLRVEIEAPTPTTPKRRHLSLLPLKTLLPSRMFSDRALSAHPTPTLGASPYASSPMSFFRSTGSLATGSFLKLPLSPTSATPSRKTSFLARTLFSKGKEKDRVQHETVDRESLHSWEILPMEEPISLMSAVENMSETISSKAVSPSSANGAPLTLAQNTRMSSSPHTAHSSYSPVQNVTSPLPPPAAPVRPSSPLSPTIPTPTSAASSSIGTGRRDDSIYPIHPLSERDRKVSATLFINRQVRKQNALKSPSRVHLPSSPVATYTGPPPLTTVRTRNVQDTTQKVAQHSGSASVTQLTSDFGPESPLNLPSPQDTDAGLLQQALETPLPSTPLAQSFVEPETDSPTSPSTPMYTPSQSPVTPILSRIPTPAQSPTTPTTPEMYVTPVGTFPTTPIPGRAEVVGDSNRSSNSDIARWHSTVTANDEHVVKHRDHADTAHCPIETRPSSFTISERSPSPTQAENMSPRRRHYPGRPLPRPPGPRPLIDSTYAPSEDLSFDNSRGNDRTCPEGLLIDLNDPSPSSGFSTPRSEEGRFQSQLSLSVYPASSRTDLFESNTDLSLPSSPHPDVSPPHSPVTPANLTSLSDMTDLDILLSQLGDGGRDGSDYEALLLVQELMGPATPARATAISSPLSPGSSINLNISLTGRIDIERHRITSDGRVKLKLGLLGVAVDRCGICLSQFRGDDLAGLGSVCKHAFHQKCIKKWLDRNKTCPMCRVPLYVD